MQCKGNLRNLPGLKADCLIMDPRNPVSATRVPETQTFGVVLRRSKHCLLPCLQGDGSVSTPSFSAGRLSSTI